MGSRHALGELPADWLLTEEERQKVADACVEVFDGLPRTWNSTRNTRLPGNAEARGWATVPVGGSTNWWERDPRLLGGPTGSSRLLLVNLDKWHDHPDSIPDVFDVPYQNIAQELDGRSWYGLVVIEPSQGMILEDDDFEVWIGERVYLEWSLGEPIEELRRQFRREVDEDEPRWSHIADFYGCPAEA